MQYPGGGRGRVARLLLVATLLAIGLSALPRPVYAEVPVAEIEDTEARKQASLDRFDLIGLTLAKPPAGPVRIRTVDNGRWSDWVEIDFDADGPDPGSKESRRQRPGITSPPLWVGGADGYEIDAATSDLTQPVVHLGRERLRRRLVLQESPIRAAPFINSRSSWGARTPRDSIDEAPNLEVAFVHHSVTTNSYSPSDVPGILRGIQAYHMDSNRWSDIGYNFAVDRFGQVWEARSGGPMRAMVGAHAGGFNTASVGVVLLGDHTSTAPTSASISAVSDLIGWRFAVAESDPRGSYAYTTKSGSTKYGAGTTVNLNRVSSHRDVGQTSCPGSQVTYGTLNTIRAGVAQRYSAYAGSVSTRWLSSYTRRFADRHGISTGAPDIATVGGGVEIVVRGLDDQLWRGRLAGGKWSGFAPLGGVLRSAPAIAGTGTGVDVVARGADGALWWKRRTSGWSEWRSLGGRITSAPDIASTGDGGVVVAARGADGAVWMRSRTGPSGPWTGWDRLGGGTPAESNVAVVTGVLGSIDVYIRGLDNKLWTRSRSLGGWSGWNAVGGVLTAGPTASTNGAGVVDVVVRGADSRLWHSRRNAGWTPWRGVTRNPVGSSGGLTASSQGRLELVADTPDGRTFTNYWTSQAGW